MSIDKKLKLTSITLALLTLIIHFINYYHQINNQMIINPLNNPVSDYNFASFYGGAIIV